MIEFAGINYYIDVVALDKAISPNGVKPNDVLTTSEKQVIIDKSGNTVETMITETSVLRGKEIDGAKYEIIRMMIETLIDYEEEADTSLGVERALSKTPLSYKLAFNTLYNYGILKEK